MIAILMLMFVIPVAIGLGLLMFVVQWMIAYEPPQQPKLSRWDMLEAETDLNIDKERLHAMRRQWGAQMGG